MPTEKSDRVVFDTNVIITLLLKEQFEFFADLKHRYGVTLSQWKRILKNS